MFGSRSGRYISLKANRRDGFGLSFGPCRLLSARVMADGCIERRLMTDLVSTADLLRRARGGRSGSGRPLPPASAAVAALGSRTVPAMDPRSPRHRRRGAGDVTQTLKRIDVFEPRHEGALQAYLRQALINRVRDEVRRLSRYPAAGGMEEDESMRTVGVAAGGSDRPRSGGAIRSGHAAIATRGAGNDHRARRDAAKLRADCRGAGKASADAARMAVTRALVRLAEEMDVES